MAESKETAQQGGIGLAGLLFILFLTLKLLGITAVANWSWWWVTAPLWLPAAIVFGFFALVILLALASVVKGE